MPSSHSSAIISELEVEFNRVQQQSRIAAAVALSVLGIGTVFYRFVEDFRWIDAFYFCTITLTTIGYGDLTPKTDLRKLFTIGYVLVGIGIIAFFANIVIKHAFIRRELKQARMRSKV